MSVPFLTKLGRHESPSITESRPALRFAYSPVLQRCAVQLSYLGWWGGNLSSRSRTQLGLFKPRLCRMLAQLF